MEETAAAEEIRIPADGITGLFEKLGINHFFSSLIAALFVLVIGLVLMKILNRLLDRALKKAVRMDETLKRFFRMAVKIVLWMVVLLTAAGVLGIPVTSVVAVVAIVGTALSLSLQTLLTNLFSGITLLFTRPIRVDEYVEIGERGGTVRSIGLFYTTLLTPNGQVVTLPNTDVANTAIVNYGREPKRRAQLRYSASYADDTEAVCAAILAAAGREPSVLGDPAPEAFIDSYKDSAIEYCVNLWFPVDAYWGGVHRMNALVREEFASRGIHMTYGHLNVHILEDARGKA